jgi:hypothetical protein
MKVISIAVISLSPSTSGDCCDVRHRTLIQLNS